MTKENKTDYKTDYWVGWDYFIRHPGDIDSANCNVCDSKMVVTKNVNGPTSSIGAQFGEKTLYYSYYCPNSGKPWHTQIRKLKMEMEKTSSKKIRKILKEEIEETLNNRKTS